MTGSIQRVTTARVRRIVAGANGLPVCAVRVKWDTAPRYAHGAHDPAYRWASRYAIVRADGFHPWRALVTWDADSVSVR